MSRVDAWRDVLALLHGGVGQVYGAAALSCGRGGEALCTAVGAANLSTIFDVASLTKALCTSVLCMRLIEADRLALDEAVLPGVSVRALLSHTSGLPAWRPLYRETIADRDLAVLLDLDGPARQQIVAEAARTPRSSGPARAVYSDLGFILLGDFLEKRLGERLDVAFARLAAALGIELGFRPLDFSHHSIAANRCAPTRRETADRQLLQGVVHDDNARAMLGVAGHAGLFGTVSSVAQLGLALLDAYDDAGTSAQRALGVSAQTVRRFFASPAQPAGATFGLGWDHPDPLIDIDKPDASPSSAGRLWSRDGVGHLGFTGCSIWLEPARRTFVVFLSNRVCAETTAAAERSHAAIKTLRPALHDAVLTALAT